MTTIKIAATGVTSKQVCVPRRELNADELALVTGGRSAKPSATPKEFLTFRFNMVSV